METTAPYARTVQALVAGAAPVALVAGILVLAIWGQALPAFLQVLCWALLGLAAAWLLRRGWLRLFGPVLFYDMVRQARRLRYFILRIGYAGVLVFFLLVAYLEHRPFNNPGAERQQLNLRMAESYFFRFVIIQFVAVALLTPAYVGGAIADEKERKTLEFMLATDLENREIVLSKLLSRLANLTLIVLIGMPILSFLQFLGGIDPNLLLASFAATFLTMFGMGGFSIFASVYLRKPRDAIVVSYLGPIVYVAIGLVAYFFSGWTGAVVGVGGFWSNLGDAIGWYNAGNLPLALAAVRASTYTGMTETVLAAVLRDYAVFHLLVGGVFTAWAVLRLRAVALQQAHGTTAKRRLTHKVRPEVWDESLLWKEIFVEDRPRRSWVARFFTMCLVLLTVGLLAVRFVPDMLLGALNRHEVADWTTIMGTAVGSLIILAAAVRASTCISGERDKDTFDFLLTTPLTSEAILRAKFLGCLLNMRRSLLWIGVIWAFAVVCGGMSIPGVFALFLSLLIYVTTYILVGLWFSMNARSTMRATVFTILTTAGISCGHWLFTFCCAALSHGGGGIEGLVKLQAGMTPPVVLGFFHFLSTTEHLEWGHGAGELVAYCVGGLLAHVLGCVLFFAGVLSPRFREITHRNNVRG